ncbi:uncharacterized protein CDV56_108165 [Aspergillus thermomutatus]|uniref:Mid2 domain-containing protein n=1 Tax=Aspergillus thermomutatus TaxID=41047 RepID=A0A397GZL0_ASPTH|nr:uncharacterized protein CDV56_108165 [Aspergillus thermomutatus]RHZ56295.1 hypothetical protein CDV56_108165 [Aspergillus thermomutatus]
MLRSAPFAGDMLRLISALFFFLSSLAAAEPGIFYNPPTGGPIHDYTANPVYVLGQTVQLRWATSLEWFSLVLWQNDNSDYEWIQTNLTGVTTYDWIVSTNRDLDDGIVFFFQIRDATDISNQSRLFASHYFNITKDDSKTTKTPSTSSSSTTSTASTSASGSATTTMTTPTVLLTASVALTTSGPAPTAPASSTAAADSGSTTNSSSPSDNTQSSGLSPQTKLGVGVGVGLGCALLIALGFIWYLLRRSKKASKPPPFDPMYYPSNPGGFTKPRIHQQAPVEVDGDRGIEVPAEQVRYELPS